MSRVPNTRLETLVQAAGLSVAQLARAMRALAAEQDLSLSYAPTTVRRWLAGSQPRPPAPALLLECLSRHLRRPVSAEEAGLTHTPAVAVDPAWEADPLRKLSRLTGAELDPARQSLLGTDVFSLAALVMPQRIMSPSAAGQPASAGPCSARPGPAEAERSRSTPTEADCMHGMATLFHMAADRYGGEPVRAALAAFLAQHVVPAIAAPGREQIPRDVLSAAAQLTLLLGNMSADSGHDRTAQHYHHIAARFSADAGDSATLAITLRAMAAHAHELGHHTPAVLHLSQQAVSLADAAPPAVQAYTQALHAVLLAHHDRRAALDALARAERLHARTDGPPGPFTAYPVGALCYQRAQTLSVLGDHSGAVKALNTSLRLRTANEDRSIALTRARLAETHLRIGHLEQALTHWQAFLTAYAALRSARATRHLRTMRELLQPHQRHRTAHQLLVQARLFR
ncbi:hypothetical protein [Streptomyces shenzhenensis]|uniref:hypothetical protein n=1 Tax=Streptomyces shenzhenensis TaxID=943815 RepID=UPI0033D6D833